MRKYCNRYFRDIGTSVGRSGREEKASGQKIYVGKSCGVTASEQMSKEGLACKVLVQ